MRALSWTCRGACADRIRPKVDGSSTKCPGKSKFARLKRLNAWRPTVNAVRPPACKRFDTARSKEANPGPRTLLRPAFPNVNGAGMANAAVLNQASGVGLD